MSEKFEKLRNAFDNYPSFSDTGMFLNALIDYQLIKARYPFGDLDRKYKSMDYIPTNAQKNDIRHYYTSAKFIQKYPEKFVRDLGSFKEDADQIDNKSLQDTQGDFINNEKGINLGKKYPQAPDNYLFDYIIQDLGMPLLPRKNTLYGYITKTEDK